MKIASLSDKALIEEICNDPRLRVWTSFDGAPPCDATKYLTKPSFSVVGTEGCFLALCLDAGRYVIHTNLLPHCRGEDAVKVAHEALRIAFIQTDATELLTMVPVTMPHAKLMARRMGLRHLFDRNALWPVGNERVAMGFYSLTLADWIVTGACAAAGQWFHDQLQDATHPDDPVHDAFVGAAVEMVKAGQPVKAIETYNRWARFALYEPAKIVSLDPLRIDIKHCVLRVEGDQFFKESPCPKA